MSPQGTQGVSRAAEPSAILKIRLWMSKTASECREGPLEAAEPAGGHWALPSPTLQAAEHSLRDVVPCSDGAAVFPGCWSFPRLLELVFPGFWGSALVPGTVQPCTGTAPIVHPAPKRTESITYYLNELQPPDCATCAWVALGQQGQGSRVLAASLPWSSALQELVLPRFSCHGTTPVPCEEGQVPFWDPCTWKQTSQQLCSSSVFKFVHFIKAS